MLRVHHRQRLDMGEPMHEHPLVRLAQHRLAVVDTHDPLRGRIIGQRNTGADADVEDAPADALGRGDRSLAAGVENRAEDEIVDRRPARIGLRDRVDVDFARHRPRHAYLRAVASLTRDYETHIRLAPDATPASRTGATRVAATALWINPPPSTRACPSPAS